MLNPESVKKYFSQDDLWEMLWHLRKRVNEGDDDPIECQVDKLLTLVEQALYPAWPHGCFSSRGMLVILESRHPDGCPEYGIIVPEDNGRVLHCDVYGYCTSEDMVAWLEDDDVISSVEVGKFIMSNPTLMKGLRYWVRKRRHAES